MSRPSISSENSGLDTELYQRQISVLKYPDKAKYFHEMMTSHLTCLKSGAHTDMVLVCPQQNDLMTVRVSE